MRRWLVRICVLLLLGAIVSVAVAWGIARFNGIDDDYESHGLSGPWLIIMFEDAAAVRIGCVGNDSGKSELPASYPMPRASAPTWVREYLSHPRVMTSESGIKQKERTKSIDAFGWPLLSVWGARTERLSFDAEGQVTIENLDYYSFVLIPEPSSRREILYPFRPLWPGFAINTAFYAFVLGLLFAAPFALRRLRGGRRIRRGLCPKCAYPRGAGSNQVCTECGAAVVKQKAETQKAEIA